uniref:Ig-like domain-containing protein n=1 Tax=Acrobeloides nanus TaxID=290746 RepID=A0A914EQW7_9BILA
MSFELNTPISDLPFGVFQQLARAIEANNLWQHIFDNNDAVYKLSPLEMEKYSRLQDPGTHLLRLLGIRGQTIKSFISKLHALAKVYGSDMDKPQLILKRKFCPVIWARPEQILVSIVGDGSQLKLQCKTSGFPTPQYQWFEEDRLLEGVSTSSIVISRCPCTARNVFRCKVWNVVEDGQEWSSFYRANGKVYYSELISNIVDLSSFASPNQ